MRLLVFRLKEQHFALPLAVVERVVQAVEVTPLPGAPAVVLGAIDVAGRVLPVLDVRRRMSMPARQIDPADQFLIARTARRTVVLAIDEAHGVIDREPSARVDSAWTVPGIEHLRGVVQGDDGLVLIQDLEQFLSLDEERSLDQALERAG